MEEVRDSTNENLFKDGLLDEYRYKIEEYLK